MFRRNLIVIFLVMHLFMHNSMAREEYMDFVGDVEDSQNYAKTPKKGDCNCQQEIESLKNRIELIEQAIHQLRTSAGNVQEGSLSHESLSHNSAKHSKDKSNPEQESSGKLELLHSNKIDSPKIDNAVKDDKQRYDLALIALKDNNLMDAEKKFADFISLYPESSMIGNAYFWYGETFFKRGDFEKAGINYLKCYKHSPKGAKASDALLKLALSLGEMKKIKEACAMLSKLDKEFRDRPASSIKRSKDTQNKYGCR